MKEGRTNRYYGKYRGTVFNNVDPQQRGRIQAIVPDVQGLVPTTWALPCVPMAGIEQGVFMIPQLKAAVWIEFENFVFWFTAEDDARVANPVERIRRYNLSPAASPRVRAWRFALTNERRLGNSNPIEGRKSPINWPLRHYPMRSLEQARRRAQHDRNQAGFQFGDKNWHYERFREDETALAVPAQMLHRFDGRHLSREITWTFYERPARLAR